MPPTVPTRSGPPAARQHGPSTVRSPTRPPKVIHGTVHVHTHHSKRILNPIRAQALVRSLEAVGVDVVFGIPGGAILPAYDPLLDSTNLRHILLRHEQGAGHAADRVRPRPARSACAWPPAGPGATNLVTPIADANMDSVPMVAITGQVAPGADRHRRLPGGRHLRHHPARSPSTTSWSMSPGRIAAHDRRGVPRRDHGPARPGADRRARRTSSRRAPRCWPPAMDLPGYRRQLGRTASRCARRPG